jgi:hypothetical protein
VLFAKDGILLCSPLAFLQIAHMSVLSFLLSVSSRVLQVLRFGSGISEVCQERVPESFRTEWAFLGLFCPGPPETGQILSGCMQIFFVCAALCYDAWSTMIHTEWGSKLSLLQYCRLDIARSHSPYPEHKAALHQEVIYSTAHCLKTSGNACVHTKDGQSQPNFHHTQSQCPMVNVTRCCASPRHLLGMQISQQLKHI